MKNPSQQDLKLIVVILRVKTIAEMVKIELSEKPGESKA